MQEDNPHQVTGEAPAVVGAVTLALQKIEDQASTLLRSIDGDGSRFMPMRAPVDYIRRLAVSATANSSLTADPGPGTVGGPLEDDLTSSSEPITGFTPGPWARNHTRVESRDEHGWANEVWIVCECLGPDAEANAAVIAETRNATPGLIAQITNQESEISRLKQALEELIEAAKHMPTSTAGPGHAESKFNYGLESWAVWGLDRALKKAREALRPALEK